VNFTVSCANLVGRKFDEIGNRVGRQRCWWYTPRVITTGPEIQEAVRAGGKIMAKKSRLTRTAASIGAVAGKMDRKAHQIAKAGVVAKKELAAISKQVDALKKQLQTTTKRLKRALT
jgi:hypothetical protein